MRPARLTPARLTPACLTPARLTPARLLPGLAVFRRYHRSWLAPDLLGGLTVGAMLIPQAMAYAELAKLPPQYGFHAVIAALFLYAIVGTSRHLGVGPEPGTAILAATGVAALAAGDPNRYVTLMALLALLVGGICVLAGLAGLGFIAAALSKPVLVGYITGVGLTLLSSQIAAFTGASISADRFFGRFAELFRELGTVHLSTLLLAAATLAVILLLKRFAPRAPGALIAVVGASVAVAVFGLADRHGVRLIGAIPTGLPTPELPTRVSAADALALLATAAGIALVGYTDNLLTARSLAARHNYRVDPDQELIALGVNNLASGLSQGFPISSSASRTAVPASLGSKTQLVGVVAAGFVMLTLLFAADLLAQIPRAGLAAVIVSAAIAIIDVPGYRSLWRVSRTEAALAGVTALAVITTDVLIGVLIAVGLSILVALGRMARPHDAVLGDAPDLDGWIETDSYPQAATEPGLLVYRFDAPLFFVNADRFRERVTTALLDNPGEEEWLVLDLEGVGTLDATALDMLVELVEQLQVTGVTTIAVARANEAVRELLDRAGLTEAAGGALVVYPTINAAVRAFRARAEVG